MSVAQSRQQFLVNKRMKKRKNWMRKAQPTDILPRSRTFSSPGKSCIPQVCCGCLARWHQAGGGDEEQKGEAGGGGGGKERHACGLRPPSTGTLQDHYDLGSIAGKLQRLLVSC